MPFSNISIMLFFKSPSFLRFHWAIFVLIGPNEVLRLIILITTAVTQRHLKY